MKHLSFLLFLILIQTALFGQYSLSGIVLDGNGKPLSGANVILPNLSQQLVTGSHGEFNASVVSKESQTIQVTYIGFKPFSQVVSAGDTQKLKIVLSPLTILTEEVLVSSSRAEYKSPLAYTNVGTAEIRAMNQGQDIPYLLNYTPSFVATSDAGNGVGYTNFRIRGTDPTRVNVTINGVPMSDAESQSTYFVDIPDLASSTENIQVQRGVGNSTNGASAFGASIDLQTTKLNAEAKANYSSSVGSFNTFRNTLSASSGLLKNKLAFDVSMSKISSAGFIDRASSDLKSFFISGGYFTDKTILKATAFSGFEQTYQAWNGVPSVRLNNDIAGMNQYESDGLYSHQQTLEMLNSNSRTYNLYTYKNQVDHYQQDNYQLQFSHQFNEDLNIKASAFYTYGRGYYEQMVPGQSYADYGLTSPLVNGSAVSNSDMITRKWLDNNFYGTIFSMNYRKDNNTLTLGGGASIYDGQHFGRVLWSQAAGYANPQLEWYRGSGLKKDANLYGRYSVQLTNHLMGSADLQVRNVNYQIGGFDDDLRNITQSHKYNFFNPKFGLFYTPNIHREAYLNFSRANREPNRDNFVDADPQGKQPTFETLNDIEIGYKLKGSDYAIGLNAYGMMYKNQLILTGQINAVGSPIMTNVDDSYRKGIELMTSVKFLKKFQWNVNATLSQNKLQHYVEYVEDWDNGGLHENKMSGETDIAFSPNLTANSVLSFKACKTVDISLLSNYVGKQFIDNSASNDRILKAYFIQNLRFDYTMPQKLFKELKLKLLVNNLLDEKYESNAWVYSYLYNGQRNKMDGYFPQAGTNFMFSVIVGF